jgi:hypothetical protein
MSDQALVQAIERVLDASPDGLNEREVRRAAVEQFGLRCRPQEVREALRQNPDRFVGPLAGGVWRLRAVVQTEEIAEGAQEGLREERGEIVRPYLADLPSLDTFIAFDLETTGVKPDHDRIIQVSAVRIAGGEPAPAQADDGTELPPVFDAYVNLGDRRLPYGLRVKLGFTDHPDWEEALQNADPL